MHNNAVSYSHTPSVTATIHKKCEYCVRPLNVEIDDFLTCQLCQNSVHVKCLRHASTPGGLFGDVFFDFTCSNCNDDAMLQFEGPSTSSKVMAPCEKLVRQRLPWLMVITLALYNLSLKSKGLSHHGYFHWRTHIVSFIDKNWDYLFEPATRRRKKWIGSVSGALSHNSPEFFLSGHDVIHEAGWWKLTHSNRKPKYIYKLYEQQLLKRQQIRNDKRLLEEPINNSTPETISDIEIKRGRSADIAEETIIHTDSCSRTIPYMGRKPKRINNQRNNIDVCKNVDKNLKKQQQIQPEEATDHQGLNSVQSNLMDFLAESLASDDLIFHDLPNIATGPIISLGKPDDDDLLQLIKDTDVVTNTVKIGPPFSNGFDWNETATNQGHFDIKLNGFNAHSGQLEQMQNHNKDNHLQDHVKDTSLKLSNEVKCENHRDVSVTEANDNDNEEYKPRILKVTNYQPGETQTAIQTKISPAKTMNKTEKNRDSVNLNERTNKRRRKDSSEQINQGSQKVDNDDGAFSDSSSDESRNKLEPCKASLFTKRRQQRELPWLVRRQQQEEGEEPHICEQFAEEENNHSTSNESIIMMSEYEEKELLQKLRKIFNLEEKCNISIPSYIRRFYRKLCIREWKREHSKPLFNLGDYSEIRRKATSSWDTKTNAQIIDRYQLLSGSSVDARSSFYARIAGSFHYELFESPYTQRVLHPFIYRNSKCCPPWLKLMCELQFVVNGTIPKRATIDYCYVRPNHIAGVNALLQSVFWPGIDMTECLSYPDFSVVALYKKLIVGCGFLVPDVGFNEAYISFMAVRPGWQRSGIATFMLYHLIQTCLSKDITLHVSATNPAVVLYQKFGFKIEEVILDFYEKYLPLHSTHSRHAFFLRLMR